ncbi:MAG: NAD(+) synthase, partial [Fibrobacter sp.]|nr:NAD(+) synthase [Fibrobacter sp.]
MFSNHNFSKEVLKLDCEKETDKICRQMRSILSEQLKRRGIVVGISGGIDSSVTLALAVMALGKERVFAIQMPEKHSAEETLYLSGLVADHFGVERVHEDITDILSSLKFYQRYAETIKQIIPDFTEE